MVSCGVIVCGVSAPNDPIELGVNTAHPWIRAVSSTFHKPSIPIFQASFGLDSATTEANDLRTRAMQYTDDILANVQSILSTGMDSFESAQNTMMTSLNSSLNVVVESRKELGGAEDEESVEDGEDDNLSVDLL